jgi:hypothetical protein
MAAADSRHVGVIEPRMSRYGQATKGPARRLPAARRPSKEVSRHFEIDVNLPHGIFGGSGLYPHEGQSEGAEKGKNSTLSHRRVWIVQLKYALTGVRHAAQTASE